MFDQLAAAAGDADQLFAELARQLAAAGKFHELFDARLTEARYRLGLPLERSAQLDDIAEPARSQLEDAYLEACREVGQLLLEAGRLAEAWMYLRPAGEKHRVREALERIIPDDDTIEELTQIALHEGVAPERGLGWMLGHYGTCNSVTAFEGLAGGLAPADQRACAAVLVRHLHQELTANVRGHIERHEGQPPSEPTLAAMVVYRPWLFEGGAYHVDTSHLASVVRFARLLEEPEAVRLAVDLTEYGRRLDQSLQYAGDPPFADTYASHRLLLLATLGEAVDEALAYFADQAKSTSVEEFGTAAIETNLILLCRVGRQADALAALGESSAAGVSLSPYAPTPFELARASGEWQRYLAVMRERGDAVGFAIGQLAGDAVGEA